MLSCATNQAAVTVAVGPATFPDLSITGVHRVGNSIGLSTPFPWGSIQISTNLVNWEQAHAFQLQFLGGRPQMYVRLSSHHWKCIENLRFIDSVKRDWAFNDFRSATDFPSESDLFPSPLAVPTCPSDGNYWLGAVSEKPVCNIVSHTL
jgi:hypothetical protein